MVVRIVVIGAGYAGTAAIKKLEDILPSESELYWISDSSNHFMLHQSYKIIRKPELAEDITFPIEEIKSKDTEFIEDRVTSIDVKNRSIELRSNNDIDYDYLLVAIGSETAFYGIEGVKEHGLSLKNRNDALKIHNKIKKAAENTSNGNQTKVFIGGSGLTGIQCAGELAEYKKDRNISLEIKLIEALDKIFPNGEQKLRNRLRKAIEKKDIDTYINSPITKVDENQIYFDSKKPEEYDVFLWTGGIRGPRLLENINIELKESNLFVKNTLKTNNDRIFAAGDTAFIEQNGEPAPPTAYVAWNSAEKAAENIVRKINNEKLKEWKYINPGTLVSVGDKVYAYDIKGIPIKTFNSLPAKLIKKYISVRWVSNITSKKKALKIWSKI